MYYMMMYASTPDPMSTPDPTTDAAYYDMMMMSSTYVVAIGKTDADNAMNMALATSVMANGQWANFAPIDRAGMVLRIGLALGNGLITEDRAVELADTWADLSYEFDQATDALNYGISLREQADTAFIAGTAASLAGNWGGAMANFNASNDKYMQALEWFGHALALRQMAQDVIDYMNAQLP
ncbi:MAG: hypothetical protein ABIP54_02495, partial [Candidatus Andersenbacteria bacterium]